MRSTYDPMANSLERQAWEYQQKLIDEMDADVSLGQLPDGSTVVGQATPTPAPAPAAPIVTTDQVSALLARLQATATNFGFDSNTLQSCGKVAAASAVAGYVAGRVGLVRTAIGVGLALVVLNVVGGNSQPSQ
jgi:hypothetical protein